MVLTGTLDSIRPGMTLSSALTSTITGATLITATATESSTGFILSDVSLSNATATGFTTLSATGYSFTITPTTLSGVVTVSVGTGVFSDTA